MLHRTYLLVLCSLAVLSPILTNFLPRIHQSRFIPRWCLSQKGMVISEKPVKSRVSAKTSRIILRANYLKKSVGEVCRFGLLAGSASKNHLRFHSRICLSVVLWESSAYRSVVATEAWPRKFLIAIRGTPASSI